MKNNSFEKAKTAFLQTRSHRGLFTVTAILSVVYFYVIAFTFPVGVSLLFALLIAGEIFHVYQVLSFIFTTWDTSYLHKRDPSFTPHVDVFITVAGEEADIVEETTRAVKNMTYPDFSVYILNDGYVAKKENWKEAEDVAEKLGVFCITRKTPGGAKAGNINNALRETGWGEGNGLVAIFDADHIPHADFLSKTATYFFDPKVAFVQTPQFYRNFAKNYITRSAWEQQELFFGPICRGRNRFNGVTMCGTNMVLRRDMLCSVGGMSEDSIAEDFLTGLLLHEKGLTSVYVPEVLAEGLAPEDFLSYSKQQFRWARGGFDALAFGFLSRRHLSLAQKFQYFSSISFYFSGLVVVMNALIPVIFLYTGMIAFTVSTMFLAAIFLPYIFLTLYMIQLSSNFSFTFRALTFSMGAFTIHIKAIWAAITREKSSFQVTPKKQVEGNFVSLVIPHIAYIVLVLGGIPIALMREGFSASFIANIAWAALMVGVFVPSIYAALPSGAKSHSKHVARTVDKSVSVSV